MLQTNREFAKTDRAFNAACLLVKIGKDTTLLPTMRQASKFRMGKGSAFKAMVKRKKGGK